jgi:uracil-DNA glycosylase family 4
MAQTVRGVFSQATHQAGLCIRLCIEPGSRTSPQLCCVPPENKPNSQELDNCQAYLERTLEILKPKVIVCLGRIAFERILKICSIRNSSWKFGHGALYQFEHGAWLLCSYHPSQQNTLTGKLTVKMFDEIWSKAKELTQDE